MKNLNWLKLFGVAVLIHIILIALSFFVVFVYSVAIEPGYTEDFYRVFAEDSAPFVATIGGSILLYWFVKRLNRGKNINPYLIGINLPAVYIIIDLVLVFAIMGGALDKNTLGVVLLSNFIKFLAGLAGAYRSQQARVYAKPGTDS